MSSRPLRTNATAVVIASSQCWMLGRICWGWARRRGGWAVPRAARARSSRCARSASSSWSAGDGLEHAVGGAAQVALLEAGVVVRAQPGELGDLLAAQARNAPTLPVQRDPCLVRGDLGTPRGEELAHLGPVVHGSTLRPAAGPRGALPEPG